MDYVTAVKKWPAVYAIFATIMDDVQIDAPAAREKWGASALQMANNFMSAPISEGEIRQFFWELQVRHLGITGGAFECEHDDDAFKDAVIKDYLRKNAGVSSPDPGPVASKPDITPIENKRPRPYSPPAGGPKKKPVKFWGKVTRVYEEEKEARFGGGVRHMLEIKLEGARHPVRGTCPRDIIGKVTAGDTVTMTGQLWQFDDKPGWWKYPTDPKVS